MSDKRTRRVDTKPGSQRGRLGLLDGLIGFNLRLGYNRATLLFSKGFEGVELAPIQFAALEYINHNPDCSQKDIADDIGSSPAALVAPLERLEQQGWIERRRVAEDRRRAKVSLTADGSRQLRNARKQVQRVDNQLTARLTRGEKNHLLELLRKLQQRLTPSTKPKSTDATDA